MAYFRNEEDVPIDVYLDLADCVDHFDSTKCLGSCDSQVNELFYQTAQTSSFLFWCYVSH